MRYLKGHGTENDFVVLPDADEVTLTPALVRALCDRRAGIGADGVLRAVRDGSLWFMDHRNADGSVAEMCGNGIRLYARYLVDAGLAEPGRLDVVTRAGVKQVTVGRAGDVTVEMGIAKVVGTSSAAIGSHIHEGTHVDMGNPHLVCIVDGALDAYDLSRPPSVDAAVFPEGVNLELVSPLGDRHVVMRVHERGVGETRSCGTGAGAVAVAMARATATDAGEWLVDVPGGRLVVTLDGETVRLTGPAVMVSSGVMDAGWLAAHVG
ncbi:MAG: diaminopimelate epimerase [Pseudonocardiales bacterium]|nr:MAG: diaminopimelate epimerase [Pseudonocardiales bacterium]